MYKIAIDGPGGAGKSSIAREVAQRLGIVYVDTGAMYRTIGLFVKNNGVDPKDSEAVISLLGEIELDIKFDKNGQHILLCGEDVGDSIRTPEISTYASTVSAIPNVRAFLLDTQRNIAEKNSVIMDGRDIGTVIFPDADVKIFLTASPEKRAERRYNELLAKGMECDYNTILEEIKERDHRDSTREIAPLKPADDAVVFDNSDYDKDESIEECIKIIGKKINLKKLKKLKKKKEKPSFYMRVYKRFAKFFVKFTRIHVHGLENIPKEGGAIICANHISMWDVCSIGAVIPRQIRFLAKKELFKVPIAKQFITAMGACSVDRKGSDVQAIRTMISLAENGELLAIFPQGTRRSKENPANTPVKSGAGLIAYKSKVPIIPVCIVTKNMKNRLFRRKDVYIGKPLTYDELGFENGGKEEYARAVETVFGKVCELGGFEKGRALLK